MKSNVVVRPAFYLARIERARAKMTNAHGRADVLREEYRATIIDATQHGVSQAAIARHLGLSRGRVRQIIQGA